MASQALAKSENGPVPQDAKSALGQLQNRLTELSAETQRMRIAEYCKASGEVSLQREIQTMHQTMVAGIPAQAFTSMQAFK